jgi:hypothetical protein
MLVTAAPLGLSNEITSFLVGSDVIAPSDDTACADGERVDALCVHFGPLRVANFPAWEAPFFGNVIAPSGHPEALWSEGGSDSVQGLYGMGEHRLRRFAVEWARAEPRSGAFTGPVGIPPVDSLDYVRCDERPWMVITGGRGESVTVAAIPASCTSMGSAPAPGMTGGN